MKNNRNKTGQETKEKKTDRETEEQREQRERKESTSSSTILSIAETQHISSGESVTLQGKAPVMPKQRYEADRRQKKDSRMAKKRSNCTLHIYDIPIWTEI